MNLNTLLPIIVTLFALAFLDPFQLLMPEGSTKIILGLLVLTSIIYGVLIFKEKALDEREAHIRALSHRVSYLVGMIGLVGIITYYLITKGHVYPETVILLVLLVVTKSAVHWYAERYL